MGPKGLLESQVIRVDEVEETTERASYFLLIILQAQVLCPQRGWTF